MRIAFLTDTFLPEMNGVVSYVFENAKRLAERGHEVVVYAPKPSRSDKFILPQLRFKIVFLPSLPAFVWPEARITLPVLPKLLIDLKKSNCEIIHIQMPLPIGIEGLIASKILKIPLIATFHSFYIDKPFFEDLKLEKIHNHVEDPLWNLCTWFHNQADIVICPSKEAQNVLIKYGLTKKSVLIPNSIDHRSVQRGENANISVWQKKFGISKTDKVAIFCGRLSADKNIEMLIKIWRKVVADISNAKLMIIGSGAREQSLKLLSNKLKLKKNIIFTGRISRDFLIEAGLLRVGQLAVSASKIENSSYALLEQMAFGLPVVAFNIRGIPEIVNKNSGILVKSDDIDFFAEKIVELFSDPKKLEKLSVGAKNKALEFDLGKNIKLLEIIYSKLINKK